jgi:hypothetical protein
MRIWLCKAFYAIIFRNMKPTPFTRSLRFASFLSVVSGLGLAAYNGMAFVTMTGLSANLTRDIVSGVTGATLKPAAMDPVNVYDKADASVQVALGMLMVIFGLLVYVAAHLREERNVHITVVPKKKRTAWFWMEMKV